jgi:hypothetical protein
MPFFGRFKLNLISPLRRRNHQAGQIAQLERKLDGLVSLLGTSPQPAINREPTAITPESIGPSSRDPISTSTPTSPGHIILPNLALTKESHAMPSMTSGSPSPAVAVDEHFDLEATSFAPVSKSPDELLNIFRCDMARQVPFISIPPQISAQALSRESPFFCRAIITVASYHDSLHQIQMGQELVKYLTEHLIVLGEKNMDLLQGRLVYIAWSVAATPVTIQYCTTKLFFPGTTTYSMQIRR